MMIVFMLVDSKFSSIELFFSNLNFLTRNLIVRLNRDNIEDRTSSVRNLSRINNINYFYNRFINQLIFHQNEMKYKNVYHIH
jgi:hypothetical protein